MRTFVLLGYLAMVRFAAAQTCTGGLGDPIVDITFGQGYDIGPALPTGTTTLVWTTSSCPNDGQYTIVSFSPSCFGSTWQPLGADHTGNQAGKYMLINASYQPSDFYVQRVDGLCPGTSYQFAAWVLNLSANSGLILPNITFRIERTDGTVLASFATGDVPYANPSKWDQYAFYFTTPAGVSSVLLRMTNNAPGGNGNDFALDDITFRAAGPLVQMGVAGFPADTVTVCQYNQQVMTLAASVESCYLTQELQWQQSSDSGKNWSDIPGATTLRYQRPTTAPGYYLYRLVIAQTGNLGTKSCEVLSPPIAITIVRDAVPAVTIATPYSAICLGLPTTFTASEVDGGSTPHYQWFVNGSPVGQDVAAFTSSGLLGGESVSCVLTSDAGCAKSPTANSNILTLPGVSVPVQHLRIDATATAICQDSLVKFVAQPDNGGATPAYQWQVNGVDVGLGTPVFTDAGLKDGDVVNCIMTGSLICSQPVGADPVVKMIVYPLPVIRLDSMVIIGGGSSIRLEPVISGDVVKWIWSPGAGLDDPFRADPVASPAVTTDYQLYVVTAEGCHTLASELVEVYYPLRMPGAFTPNGDGRNDVFRVPPLTPVTIHYLAVYNRMGVRLFYTTNVSAGWDGRYNGVVQPAGGYVWELVFENPLTKKVEERMGTVVLVR
jgi:gliding motility-associated-like protein